jgi:hypothetical protein
MVMRKGLRLGVLVVLFGVFLGSCGGGGGGSITSSNTQTFSGVAATGAGVVGIITLKDIPSGQVQATHTDDGRYTFNVTGLAGPFLLRAQSDDGAVTLYGIALKSGNAVRGHLNPLTHRIVARLAMGLPSPPAELVDLFDAPAALAGLTADQLEGVTDWTLEHTSPYFRQRLLARGLSLDNVDPVSGNFVIGQGLDLAFDDVQFFHDEASGVAWEKSVASGDVVGTLRFLAGNAEPGALSLAAEAAVLASGTSQQLTATLSGTGFSPLVLGRGVAWELSDPSLAEVDARGVITAKAFTGIHALTVTAHYRNGDLHLQDSIVLTLRQLPLLDSIDMSRLPASFAPVLTYPLFTTLHIDAAAGGGTLFAFGGNWSLVDPDADTLAAVSIVSSDGVPALKIAKPVRDLSVRLRAVQMLNGEETVTERVVTVQKFVLTPVKLYMTCPNVLEYAQSLPCRAFIVNSDGSTNAVAPTLELEGDGAAHLTATGNVLTSAWDNRIYQESATVTGRYGDLTTAEPVTVYLNPRKTRITSLDLRGVSELAEGASTNYQVWATWDDGTTTNITGGNAARYTSSNDSIATFTTSYLYGGLQARYILDEDDDQDVTITAAFCRLSGYYYLEQCPAGERISTSAVVTVRYAPPVLTGRSLDAGVLAPGFLAEQASYTLQARALWNKKLIDGSSYSTVVDATSWSSDHAGAVVSGSTLTVGSAGDEPLLMLTASYQDPNDAGNTRTARRVVTLYHAAANPQRRLVYDFNGYGYSSTYLLGGDGLARPLQAVSGYPYGPDYMKVGAPRMFMNNVQQVMYFYYDTWAYLRDDGTVWYPEPVNVTTLAAEKQAQLAAQLTGSTSNSHVARRVPGLTDVTMLAAAAVGTSAPGGLAALRADGTLWMIAAQGAYGGPRSYLLTQLDDISGVTKIAGGAALYALRADGTLWSRGANWEGLGRTIASSTLAGVPFGPVLKADGTPLTGIVDITAAGGSAFALDNQGVLWAWGANSNGALGLGDTQYRLFATPVSSVTGFSQLSPGTLSALRSNGSLWRWGGSYFVDYEPQRVADFSALRYAAGPFAVAADGRVWWWGYFNFTEPANPQPVRPERASDGPQLVLP